MRQYKPLTKTDGRVHNSSQDHANPFYGQRGADWIKNTNASLFNAQREQAHRQPSHKKQVQRVLRNVLLIIVAVVVMVVGGFFLYSLALSL
ncbi:hypothetical protein [Lactiplantibacillus plajomi]|uniref:Uncharacterized protein n=1 Tax=Lactiplantibacillus plajomi TaxID=1457217 RepID=A0ABV6K0P3_9LACO|nr:hypothetical protein [Lactiplantibacillus plajomi]